MMEIDDMEKQMRSWAPRPPSAVLEHRLFGSQQEVEDASPRRAHWLVPAMAALILFGTFLSQRHEQIAGLDEGARMAGLVLSNQSSAAYLPGSFQREHNLLRPDTFEWTSLGQLRSSIQPYLSSAGTNRQ